MVPLKGNRFSRARLEAKKKKNNTLVSGNAGVEKNYSNSTFLF